MKRSSVLGNLTDAEGEELNRAAEAMRRNLLRRPAVAGDVDGYLEFLADREELFGNSVKIVRKIPLVIDKSSIL